MKKIISFSMWGKMRLYCIGAIKNALLAKKIFPGWICRYYYDNSVPEIIINYLKSLDNTELVYMDKPSGGTKYKDNGQFGMLWRFYPFNDDDVQIWIARDIDSRLSRFEYVKINEFINSNAVLHTICDTTEKICRGCSTSFKNYLNGHDTRIMDNHKINIHNIIKNINKKNCPFYSDENFLNNILYPKYSQKCLRIPRRDHKNPELFDPQITGTFVGQVLDEYDVPINKNGNQAFNYKYNYDDLYTLLDDYIKKINQQFDN